MEVVPGKRDRLPCSGAAISTPSANHHSMNRRHLLASGLLATAAATLPGLCPAAFGQAPATAKEFFKLAPLPYAPEALEPHIDAQTMMIHHGKHHQAYVTKLNEALATLPTAPQGTPEELHGWLSNLDAVPEKIRTAVRNHGGGHFNHDLFWNSLTPKKTEPTGDLARALESAFGSEEAATAEYLDKGGKIFGSGWIWLVLDPKKKALAMTTTPNQDTPLAAGHVPLLGVDVWEHAYYLKYQNKRADYLKAVANIINWDVVAERYAKALKA